MRLTFTILPDHESLFAPYKNSKVVLYRAMLDAIHARSRQDAETLEQQSVPFQPSAEANYLVARQLETQVSLLSKQIDYARDSYAHRMDEFEHMVGEIRQMLSMLLVNGNNLETILAPGSTILESNGGADGSD